MEKQAAILSKEKNTSTAQGHHANLSFFKPTIQTKLAINQPNDVHEQEADAIASSVAHTSENGAGQSFFSPTITAVQRKCQRCEEEDKKAQLKENGETQGMTGAAESYINSLDGKGKPMTGEERNFFEPRIGYDFSNVQLHTDTEAGKSAKELNAHAYTHSNHIVFAQGKYQPQTNEGKQLIAHELTHVVQQSKTGTVQRQPNAAPNFKFGNVMVNAKAASDIVSKNVLLDNEDQKHLSTANGKLGYDANYTTPEDKFRWDMIKQLVDDNTAVDINAVTNADSIPFDVYDSKSNQRIPDNNQTLMTLGATGITLPTQAMELAAYASLLADYKKQNNGVLDPGQQGYWDKRLFQVSKDATRGAVYYESNARGRASNGRNSLAHELLGHFWLVKNGKPWEHQANVNGTSIPTITSDINVANNVTDPLGGVVKGSVDNYITDNVDSNEFKFKSPTWRVGLNYLSDARDWLKSSGAAELTAMGTSGRVSDKFFENWYVLNNNYAVGGRTAGNTAVATLIKNDIISFYCGLNTANQSTFRRTMAAMTGGFGNSGHPSLLAADIMAIIMPTPMPANYSPCTAAPVQPPAGKMLPDQAFESRPVDMNGKPIDTTK